MRSVQSSSAVYECHYQIAHRGRVHYNMCIRASGPTWWRDSREMCYEIFMMKWKCWTCWNNLRTATFWWTKWTTGRFLWITNSHLQWSWAMRAVSFHPASFLKIIALKPRGVLRPGEEYKEQIVSIQVPGVLCSSFSKEAVQVPIHGLSVFMIIISEYVNWALLAWMPWTITSASSLNGIPTSSFTI